MRYDIAERLVRLKKARQRGTQTRTPAQQWQFERKFSNKGSITRMLTRVSQLLDSKNWTREEKSNLETIHINLGIIMRTYDSQTMVLERERKRGTAK